MFRKLFIISLLCFLCSLACLHAQTTDDKTAQYAISFEPNHLLNGGLRLNLETKIRSNDWLELNMTGYYLPHRDIQSSYYYGYYDYYGWGNRNAYSISNADFETISGLSGLGVGATYKHYFPRRFLIHTALSYYRYNVEYSGSDYYPYTEDGLTFYDYRWGSDHQTFQKLALHFAVGVRSTLERTLFAEPYAGMGFAYSFYDENKCNFNKTMFGYGYRGFYLTAGVKLGFNLR